ncbi:MAG: valine--tRNA ligase [Planctomycetaceae bacterium]|nr:valine--tRNA ligase [Planctomycetaceae bacterium]
MDISQPTSAPELANRYDFLTQEAEILRLWDQRQDFHAEVDPSKKPYSMVIPPPNVTGALHLGHALNNSLQDTLVRWRRMQGFNAMWMAGTDHAGIATQAVVEKRLKEEEGKTRHDLGREALVQRIWKWKDQYEQRILGQLKSLGASCDWPRTRFTLDPMCARAVFATFFDLFRKAWIYRGKKLVNWDTFLQTAVSDDEVFNETVKGNFWHIRYPVIEPQPGEPTHIIVATTRPETMLGDTAVAVHPDPAKAFDKVRTDLLEKLEKVSEKERVEVKAQLDALAERRAEMLAGLEQLAHMARSGRKLQLPLAKRTIPLIADVWAKPELGSGCVKITPAHDPNDYEVGRRAGLEMLNIMHPDGTMNVEAGAYAGLTIKEARKQVVAALEESGLLDRVEDRDIELPHSDRSKTPIEPLLANQWFVKMDQLAENAITAVNDGRVQIHPPRYARSYLDWLGEKRDWPVSRQLWWGHQIPVWSKPARDRQELKQIHDQLFDLGIDKSVGNRAAVQEEPSDESNATKRAQLNLPLATVHVCLSDPADPLSHALEAAGFVRDADVLDTWFSSALWPHSTLGWPEQTPELKYFYPTNVLVTSRDIITLWVARMVLTGLNNVDDIPFHDVYIHPKILDGFGETMSKSKGNGIDPLEIINKFGADALRLSMVQLATETQDVRLPVQFECPHCGHSFEQTKKNRVLPAVGCPKCGAEFSTQWAEKPEHRSLARGAVTSERFEVARNFVNKLWNAARFVLKHLEGYEPAPIQLNKLPVEDRWLLSRLASVTAEVTQCLQQFKFAEAARSLYQFAWDDFCSFYLEINKDRLQDPAQRSQAQQLLAAALDTLLRLLHPPMPFVTESIWQLLNQAAPVRGLDQLFAGVSAGKSEFEQGIPGPSSPSLMIAAWPALPSTWVDPQCEQQFAIFQSALAAIREIRNRQNIGPKETLSFSLRCEPAIQALLQPMAGYFKTMANAELKEIGLAIVPPQPNAVASLAGVDLFVDLAGFIDVEAEKQRLRKERDELTKANAGRQAKLTNESFVQRAPANVVEEVRQSLAQATARLEVIEQALRTLG